MAKESSKSVVTPAPAVGSALTERNTSFASQMFEDAAALAPQFERDDLSIPFLRVLQDMSPQAKPRDPAYVAGAAPGDFLHTITKQVWKGEQGLLVLPVHYEKRHIEWKRREDNGGFVADHGYKPELAATTTRDEKNRDILPNGNHLVATALYYLLVVQLDERGKLTDVTEAVLALTSTQLKVSRLWNTMMRGTTIEDPVSGARRPAQTFYRAYKLTTKVESNDKGSWYGLSVEVGPTVEQLQDGVELYTSGRNLAKMIASGQRKANVQEGLSEETVAEVVPHGDAFEDDANDSDDQPL